MDWPVRNAYVPGKMQLKGNLFLKMAKIIPFQGTCYNRELLQEIDTLFAPPYDVVTPEERERYVKLNPYNIFRLELPSAQDCKDEAPDKYQCAARLLKDWRSRQILVRDEAPCIYPYDIEFTAHGKKFIRKGMVCLVRADDWSKGSILPHERTFEKVTTDRFNLRMATRAQFSQIFMLYRHEPEIEQALDTAHREVLFRTTDPKGCSHTLSRIADADVLESISRCLEEMPLYIADGHHRYTTSIEYRKKMIELYGENPNAPYNYTMVYLVNVEDPGLIVLPTHRILKVPAGLECQDVRAMLASYFHLEEIEQPSASQQELSQAREFSRRLSESCSNGITLFFGKRRRAFVLCPRQEARQELLESLKQRELAGLDVVVLEELVFKKALGIDPHRLEAGKDIIFTADSEKAVKNLKKDEMLFFMHPTPVKQVLAVADAGLSMPHKSTFFYPKILTGMVLNVEQ